MNELQKKLRNLRQIPRVKLRIKNKFISVSTLNLLETSKELIDSQKSGYSNTVVTINWEMVSRCYLDQDYLSALAESTFIVPDGIPIVFWMKKSKTLENRTFVRVTGVDLTKKILDSVRTENINIAIIGGRELKSSLKRLKFPLNNAPFLWEGPVKREEDSQIEFFAKTINSQSIQFAFLALPSVKQNWLIPRLALLCPNTTIIGVGGTFDYLGQRKRRAPNFMQRIHLEWLWRLLNEKNTFYRYVFLYPTGITLFIIDRFKSLLSKQR